MRRALVAAIVSLFGLASVARADDCAVPRLDLADWALVRSARMPGFSLRLPRSFTRDSAIVTGVAAAATAQWTDARGRLTLSHRAPSAAPQTALPSADGRDAYARCEERLGSAAAVIVSYGAGPSAFVVHARIRWPDGEELDVRADAPDRERLEQLLVAVRTIRRAGA